MRCGSTARTGTGAIVAIVDPRRHCRHRRWPGCSPPIFRTPRCACSSASPRSPSSLYTWHRHVHASPREPRQRRASPPACSGARCPASPRRICQAGGAALPDVRAGLQNLPKMTFVGTTAIVFAIINCAQGGALFRARPVLHQGLRHLAGAAAAGDRRPTGSASGWCGSRRRRFSTAITLVIMLLISHRADPRGRDGLLLG